MDCGFAQRIVWVPSVAEKEGAIQAPRRCHRGNKLSRIIEMSQKVGA